MYAVTKEAKTTGVLCGEVKLELCVLEGDEKCRTSCGQAFMRRGLPAVACVYQACAAVETQISPCTDSSVGAGVCIRCLITCQYFEEIPFQDQSDYWNNYHILF